MSETTISLIKETALSHQAAEQEEGGYEWDGGDCKLREAWSDK